MFLPGSDQTYRVAVAGCKHTTRDLILGLARHGMQVDHCVTISPEKGADQRVAGYHDLRTFLLDRNIPFTIAQKYSLKSEADRETLLSLEIDLLLVMGWQRLIPDWWLTKLRFGAFGMHGSSQPLPHGRGRSPMNWSLVQGKTQFYTHLFKYEPGVDDGPILGVQTFDITPFDDAHTMHLKNLVAMVRLCVENLPPYLAGNREPTPQPDGRATYFPKRTADDGVIYWTDPTEEIYNLVRAVTRPFPGAFTFLNDDRENKITIWRAVPFETQLRWDYAPAGQIVEVFYDGSFVVKTGDGTILVTESEGNSLCEQDIGQQLGPAGMPRQDWRQLPA